MRGSKKDDILYLIAAIFSIAMVIAFYVGLGAIVIHFVRKFW